jgi:hypothetical protein
MRAILLATVFALATAMGTLGASALPAAGMVITSTQAAPEVGHVIQVGWRCGFDRHWSYRWRQCVRNWR